MNREFSPLLEAHLYCDAEVFAREREPLFTQHWWLIGSESELNTKGDYIATTLGRYPIFVVRDHQHSIRGLHNTCRHRAGPLVVDSHGNISGSLLVCQYHGWSYDFEGQLINAHRLNSCINKAEYSLYPIKVSLWNGMVFASVGHDAPPLIEWLGEITEIAKPFPSASSMVPLGTLEKSGNTNWKCYGDNSCEGYHVGLVHKALNSSMDQDAVTIHCYEKGKFVGFDVSYCTSAADPSRSGKGLWIYKFPGLLLHFSDNTFNAECVIPIDEGKISLRRWFWSLPKERSSLDVDPSEAVSSASIVMDEDLKICEQVFKNLSAGIYRSGVLSTHDESGTQYFQELVREFHRENGV